jgi:hypothetical protein
MSGARTTGLVSLLVIWSGPAAAPGQDPPLASGVVLSVGGDVPRPFKLTS